MIILTERRTYILAEGDSQPVKNDQFSNNTATYHIWGQRWNRNEQQWGKNTTLFIFNEWKVVDDSELPGPLRDIGV